MADHEDTDFGADLIAGLKEAVAHRRGEISLPSRRVRVMSPERVKAIRKKVAKSPKEFERKFGVPARTLEGWEQGRQPDPAARILLQVIDDSPEVAQRAAEKALEAA